MCLFTKKKRVGSQSTLLCSVVQSWSCSSRHEINYASKKDDKE